MSINREQLTNHLKSTEHILTDDPLHYTKTFLMNHNISIKSFFKWIIEDCEQFGYTINNDKNVRMHIQ